MINFREINSQKKSSDLFQKTFFVNVNMKGRKKKYQTVLPLKIVSLKKELQKLFITRDKSSEKIQKKNNAKAILIELNINFS